MKTCIIAVSALILFALGAARPAWARFEGASRQGVNLVVSEQETIVQPLSAMGVNVVMKGTTEDRMRLFGVKVQTSGTCNGPALIRGAQVTAGGTFNSTLDIAAANAELSGTYTSDVVVRAANIVIAPGTLINGDLRYTAAVVSGIDEARISGRVIRLENDKPSSEEVREWQEQARKGVKMILMGGWLVTFISLLLLGLVVVHLFPSPSARIVATMGSAAWASLGLGLVIFLLTPLAVSLLLVTVLGIPIGFVLGMTYLIALHFGPIFAGLAIGRFFLERLKRPAASTRVFLPLLLGLLLIWALQLLPFVGWLAGLLFMLYGLGGIWLSVWKEKNGRNHGEAKFIEEAEIIP